MRLGTAILIGVTAAVGITGYSYYSNVYNLQYNIAGVGVAGQNLLIKLVVYNPSRWSYPVPMLFFNVYDSNGTYWGVINSTQMQWISPGSNTIEAYLVPNLQNFLLSVSQIFSTGSSLELMFDGTITIANTPINLQLPVKSNVSL